MKILLRSCILVDPTDVEALFTTNMHALTESGMGFETVEDEQLWSYIREFFRSHNHLPKLQTLRDHFDQIGHKQVVDRLEQIVPLSPKTRGDFLTHLEDKVKERKTRTVLELAKEMAQIAAKGYEIKDTKGKVTRLEGPIDAIRFMLDRSHDLVAPTTSTRLSGNLMVGGESFLNRYDQIKADPRFGLGQYTGIAQIDEALKGAKKQELWIHAGFTGHMKSSFALQWAYIQAVYYGYSSVYFSLEMPYEQVINMIYVMHSAHEDFREIRQQLGIQGLGLDYSKVKYGKLEPHEEIFLRDYVVPDINKTATVPHDGPYSLDPRSYGDILVEVPDPDKEETRVPDLRLRAELLYAKTPFATVFVDHAGLLQSRNRHPNTTERLNEVIRDLKKMSMGFNRGLGMAVVALFQISREGFRSAEKNGGKYNLTHLSYASECLCASTPVFSSRGVVDLGKIGPGDRVWSRSGWKIVKEFFDQGERETWILTNDRGASIQATTNHRFRVLRDEQIAWARMDELQVGDRLLSTRNFPWVVEAPPLPSLRLEGKERIEGIKGSPNAGRMLSIPTHLSESLAFLWGAWHGDGVVRPNGVGYVGNRKELTLRDRLCEAFFQTFNQELLIQECPSRPGSFELTRYSPPLKRWWENLAGHAEDRGVKVPDLIFCSPRAQVVAFLRGLFDTDGWINSQHMIGLKMKSKDFLLQVQQLLLMLGIDSEVRAVKGTPNKQREGKIYPGWSLRIRGGSEGARGFQEIGFTEPWKARRLRKAAEAGNKTEMLPLGSTFVALASDYTPYSMITSGRLCRSYANDVSKARQTGMVSKVTIKALLQVLEENSVVDSRAEVLKEVLSLHVTQVARIDPAGIERVYDIEVEGDHEYQTGSFLSHNCEKSADIVTASWLGEDVKKLGRLIIQCLKSRDEGGFDRVPVRVEFPCRRLLTDRTPIEEIDERVRAAQAANAPIQFVKKNGELVQKSGPLTLEMLND